MKIRVSAVLGQNYIEGIIIYKYIIKITKTLNANFLIFVFSYKEKYLRVG